MQYCAVEYNRSLLLFASPLVQGFLNHLGCALVVGGVLLARINAHLKHLSEEIDVMPRQIFTTWPFLPLLPPSPLPSCPLPCPSA